MNQTEGGPISSLEIAYLVNASFTEGLSFSSTPFGVLSTPLYGNASNPLRLEAGKNRLQIRGCGLGQA